MPQGAGEDASRPRPRGRCPGGGGHPAAEMQSALQLMERKVVGR